MIKDSGIYFLYRHIRNDINAPFYIGIGKKNLKQNTITSVYYRAFNKRNRSELWKSIIAKTDYSVDILCESDSSDFILEKEKEFIKLYGRIRNGGTLVNLNNGGSNFQYLCGIDTVHENNSFLKKRKPVYLYDMRGLFVMEFKSQSDCARYLKRDVAYVGAGFRCKKNVGKYIFSESYLGNVADLSAFDIRKKGVKIFKLCPTTKKLLNKYNSIKEAAIDVGTSRSNISTSINRKHKCCGFLWVRESDISKMANKL